MILVTGATGFLGSELIKQLHEQGFRVRALKRTHSSIPPILQNIPDIEWFNADILDYFALENAFEGITQVYHCCGLISFHDSDKANMLRVNMEGTAHIVDLCLLHQVSKLVHVSSVAALGDSKTNSAVTEKDFWEFNGTQHGYSISKYEGEMEVWRGIAEGLNAVIVNPSVIIGKNADKKGSGKIFELISKGISYYTPGTLGLVDVEDVAKVMITLMESTITSERFIVNSANWSYKNLFAETAKRLNLPVPKKEISKFQLSAGLWLATLAALFTGKKQDLTRDTVKSAFQNALYSANKLHQFFPDLILKPIAVSIDEITDHFSTPSKNDISVY